MQPLSWYTAFPRLDFSALIYLKVATAWDGKRENTNFQIPGMNQFLRILHISPRCIILLESVIGDMRQAVSAPDKDAIQQERRSEESERGGRCEGVGFEHNCTFFGFCDSHRPRQVFVCATSGDWTFSKIMARFSRPRHVVGLSRDQINHPHSLRLGPTFFGKSGQEKPKLMPGSILLIVCRGSRSDFLEPGDGSMWSLRKCSLLL